jgi:non-ribosomal peptide synthetase component F
MSHNFATAVAIAPCDSGVEKESRSILRGQRQPELKRDELLCEIFAAAVAANPEAVAMLTRDGALTYREVDAKAEAVARGLIRKGLRPGDVAGLWMTRGHDLLIGQIAIA